MKVMFQNGSWLINDILFYVNRVDEPRSKFIPRWNNRAHVTDSKNNKSYHTHFKEFFDKKCGSH